MSYLCFLQVEQLKLSLQQQSLLTEAKVPAETDESRKNLEKDHAVIVSNMTAQKGQIEGQLVAANSKLVEVEAANKQLSGELDKLKVEVAAKQSQLEELEQSAKDNDTEDLLLLLETNSETINKLKDKLRALGEQVSESDEDDEGDDADD